MILIIDKKEKDSFNKACAIHGVQASFYTIETNDSMLKVEILSYGIEVSCSEAYWIGRETAMNRFSNTVLK